MKIQKAALFTMLFITFCGFVGATWADDDGDFFNFGAKNSDFIKSRTYIGVSGISSVIDNSNDFNGSKAATFGNSGSVSDTGSASVTLTEYDLIPAINRNFGFNVLIGHREGPWAMEISYWRTDHTATWNGGTTVTFSTPANLQSIDLDLKRYLLTQLPTQPFVNIGISFPWLWVSNGSSILDANNDPVPGGVNDETISGFGFKLGVGMEIYLDDHFSIQGGAQERWTGFNQINGAFKVPEDSLTVDGNSSDTAALEGNGLNFFVGTTVGFQ